MRKVIKFVFVFFLLVLMFLIFTVKWIDRTPYVETKHYKLWKEQIAKHKFNDVSDTFLMGWASENITPDRQVPLAGYGKRKGKHFESVHDSIYVRSVALQAGSKTIFLVSADLLFIPPKVVASVASKLEKENILLKDVHFAATHSHNSIGGWENTLTGELFGGEYDPKIVEWLADNFYKVIIKSKDGMEPGKVFYSEVKDDEDVRYRVNLPNGVKDTEIRSLRFEKQSGEVAHLITYSAHSTVLSDKILDLSRDYSGALLDSLQPDFGVFMAGAVASMGPIERGDTEFEELENQANNVLSHYRKRSESLVGNSIVSDLIRIPMPNPTGRLTQNWALRPWAFKKFFGDYETFIKVTKVGNVLILGMPADFSGEIMVELDDYAKKRGLDLIITGFNGGYIGYVTPDKMYDTGVYEVMIMSWYGYQNGGYFTEVSKDIIDKFK